MIAASPLAILEQALAWAEQGEPVALVTLVGIEGSASRAIGTQMAITAGGQHIGSFSGGCIDAAIVAEARKALDQHLGVTIRFGLGSPYIDVRLPCGGGIDLMFTPDPAIAVLRSVIGKLQSRRAADLFVTPGGIALDGPGFAVALVPQLRIVVFGQGEDLAAFARLAQVYGALLEVCTPDPVLALQLSRSGLQTRQLAHLAEPLALDSDDWTAFVFLFHDRDWEDALLPRVLALPAFYCGAIGSQRTRAARVQRLRAAGCSESALARLSGQIGLIPATRDPATLAISILAEVAACYARSNQAELPLNRLAAAG